MDREQDMKLCKTCVYGTEYELDKPCIVYRADCRYYRKVGEDMPHSLRVKLKNLQRKGELTDKDIDRIFKALEQVPCGDAISRQTAIEAFKPRGIAEDVWQECYEYKVLKSLPSVNPQETVTEFADRCRECGAKYGEVHSDFKTCPRCGVRMAESEDKE